MDRRKYPRVPYGAWIEDLTHEGSIQFYLARDLSLGGLMLAAVTPPTVGHAVHLRLIVENESRVMAIDGQVIRHGGPEGGLDTFAVRFTNLDLARQAFIEELVKEVAQNVPAAAAPAPPPATEDDPDVF